MHKLTKALAVVGLSGGYVTFSYCRKYETGVSG